MKKIIKNFKDRKKIIDLMTSLLAIGIITSLGYFIGFLLLPEYKIYFGIVFFILSLILQFMTLDTLLKVSFIFSLLNEDDDFKD
ncbi:hypothetical protein GW796_08420 [archaeon]|nr:hypothetical protein [archaeon]